MFVENIFLLILFTTVRRKNNVRIKAVATDLSAAFTLAVMKNIPEATHVFDHFHVVKLINDTLDKIRRDVYHLERDITKRKVIKGSQMAAAMQRERSPGRQV